MKDEYYAHSREGALPEHWHRLDDHLKEVAKMAWNFGEAFGASDCPYLDRLMASLWTTTMLILAYEEF